MALPVGSLDPRDLTPAVGGNPDGRLRAATVVRLLADVAQAADVVGLGITEYAPRKVALLADMLRRLPLVGEG